MAKTTFQPKSLTKQSTVTPVTKTVKAAKSIKSIKLSSGLQAELRRHAEKTCAAYGLIQQIADSIEGEATAIKLDLPYAYRSLIASVFHDVDAGNKHHLATVVSRAQCARRCWEAGASMDNIKEAESALGVVAKKLKEAEENGFPVQKKNRQGLRVALQEQESRLGVIEKELADAERTVKHAKSAYRSLLCYAPDELKARAEDKYYLARHKSGSLTDEQEHETKSALHKWAVKLELTPDMLLS